MAYAFDAWGLGMALVHKLDCPPTMIQELWEHAASGRTPPRWAHAAEGWVEAADIGDYLGAYVPLFPPLLPPEATWQVENHLWTSTGLLSSPISPTAVLRNAHSLLCKPYCVEPCAKLNGDVAMECGACDGPAYACRRGAAGFPAAAEPTSKDESADEPRALDRCHGIPHSLRWLLGRLLAADPAVRGPPAALLAGLERLERVGRELPPPHSVQGGQHAPIGIAIIHDPKEEL